MTECSAAAATTPMGAMNEADEQRKAWGVQWDTGKIRVEPQWPTIVADSMPEPTTQAFIDACTPLPIQTGLGWDTPRYCTRTNARLATTLVCG